MLPGVAETYARGSTASSSAAGTRSPRWYGLGNAIVEALAPVARARAGTAAGKTVNYTAIEVAIGEAPARIERAGHQAVLQSLDMDRPSVMIGGARFTTVGRCQATYYTMAGPGRPGAQ